MIERHPSSISVSRSSDGACVVAVIANDGTMWIHSYYGWNQLPTLPQPPTINDIEGKQ